MAQKKSLPRNKAEEKSVLISIRIQPRASKNEIIRMEGGKLKIRLTAPPVDGAANEALVKFLSNQLHVGRAQVEIVSGHTGREKIIRIAGIDNDQAERLLKSNEK